MRKTIQYSDRKIQNRSRRHSGTVAHGTLAVVITQSKTLLVNYTHIDLIYFFFVTPYMIIREKKIELVHSFSMSYSYYCPDKLFGTINRIRHF